MMRRGLLAVLLTVACVFWSDAASFAAEGDFTMTVGSPNPTPGEDGYFPADSLEVSGDSYHECQQAEVTSNRTVPLYPLTMVGEDPGPASNFELDVFDGDPTQPGYTQVGQQWGGESSPGSVFLSAGTVYWFCLATFTATPMAGQTVSAGAVMDAVLEPDADLSTVALSVEDRSVLLASLGLLVGLQAAAVVMQFGRG